MRRRDFISVAAAFVACPIPGHGQQRDRMTRIGFLGATSPSSWVAQMAALQSSLLDLGYVSGKNLLIETRWAENQYGTSSEAKVGSRLGVDVLLTYGTPGALAAKLASSDLPIVFVYSGDAVAAGLVDSLARPGGNVTGSTYFLPQLMAKRLSF